MTVSTVRTSGAAESLDRETPREKRGRLLPGLFPIDYHSVGAMAWLAWELPKDRPAGEVGVVHVRTRQVSRMRYSVQPVDRRDGRKRWRIDASTLTMTMTLHLRDDGILERWDFSDRHGNKLVYQLAGDPRADAAGTQTASERQLRFERLVRPADW